jgi:hypothetical protein
MKVQIDGEIRECRLSEVTREKQYVYHMMNEKGVLTSQHSFPFSLDGTNLAFTTNGHKYRTGKCIKQ